MASRREFIRKIAAGTAALPFMQPSFSFAGYTPQIVWRPSHLNHFPSRLYAFVYRCWDLQPVDKIARFLKTDSQSIENIACEMGLPPQPKFTPEILMRNSHPTIFRLWDILPKKQLLEFMEMTDDEFYTFMHTDITYWHAIGVQPEGLTPLAYNEPTPREREKAKQFKESICAVISEKEIPLVEESFDFIKQLNQTHAAMIPNRIETPRENEIKIDSRWTIRYAAGSGIIVENAVKDFMKFCEAVMRQPVASRREADLSSVPPYSILLQNVPGEFQDPESHTIKITSDRVEIQASDERGIMRGLYCLEDEMKYRKGPLLPKKTFQRETQFTPRYIFSYYEMYGDMLRESPGDFYPETYLQYLSHFGVNGIWLQGILSELVPSTIIQEFGKDSKMLIKRLNNLIERAKKYGMDVYMYFNEPRGQKEDFYKRYPMCRGGFLERRGGYAMCTSSQVTQGYLVIAFRDLFRLAPGLAGVFIITASENLTSCYSNSRTTDCTRCSKRKPYEVVSEVINLIARGVKMGKTEAEVIAWDWSWHNIIEEDPQAEIIKRIDPSVILMADFERGITINRGGIKTEVNEYCLSVVGPSPRAITRAKQAQEKGTEIYGKLTLSNTLEVGTVPYIPVPHQVAEKFQNMRKHGFKGAMESWTVGGYPSVNLEAAKEFYWDPDMTPKKAVLRVAIRKYGKGIAPEVTWVWEKLAASFASYYPMTNGFIYNSPIQYGSARNLHFYPLPKPYGNTTILNPKDDNNWGSNVFPPDVQIELLEKLAEDWEKGSKELHEIFERAGIVNRTAIQKDIGVVEAIAIHFKSTANQIKFNLKRDRLQSAGDKERKADLLNIIEQITNEELVLAKRHYAIARIDSRIGFEAGMQYFYRPANILEKIANCQYILKRYIPEYRKEHNF